MVDTDEEQLKRTNMSIALWEQQRDEDSIKHLDRVLSANLVFRRANKSVVGKADFMAGLAGPSPFEERHSEHATVDILGDRAVVTVTVVATKKSGSEERYRNLRIFVRRDEQWQLEFWFNDDVTHVTGL